MSYQNSLNPIPEKCTWCSEAAKYWWVYSSGFFAKIHLVFLCETCRLKVESNERFNPFKKVLP